MVSRGAYQYLILTCAFLSTFCSGANFGVSNGRSIRYEASINADRSAPARRDNSHTTVLTTSTLGRSASSIATGLATTLTSSSSSASTPTPSLSLPRPFDSILGNNFTEPSCPTFFDTFLINNATLQACVPFSLLLQNSKMFFQDAMSASTLDPVLDAGCSAPSDSCRSLMAALANNIISPSYCGNDYALENPLVIQAYRGLLSYAPMRDAACVKADPTGKSDGDDFPYCYASAVNSSSQADGQLYFLPLGWALPTGSSVSCSSCTQHTMAVFAQAASSANSPLNANYINAASMVNSVCGSNFVNASTSIVKTPSGSKTNTADHSRVSWHMLLTVAMAASLATAFPSGSGLLPL